MKVDVLLGLQWGDEGKGKVVDVLTPNYDVITRFQGGPNAGHTLEFNGQKHVLRSIPSGVFQPDTVNIIGNGVVLDPVLFMKEADELMGFGVDLKKILCISRKTHLIMPTHRLLDAANEAAKGKGKIGTTGKGIGPCYTDKVSRYGIRVGDIFFLSGQIPLDPATGKLVEGDICAQAEQCCKNVVALLESQGLTTANVAKTTVFIADMNDFPKVNEVYKKYFCEPFPARSCVAIKSLPLGAQVEVEAIAAL